MQAIHGYADEALVVGQRRSAARFFWMWLVVASAMSVTGNVAHAVLQASPETVTFAAGAALVPPLVLLASTHSVAVLVRTRAGGATYWCALLMTLALATCAFVLSFDALRSLAVALGLPAAIAWLWPCAIDVAIAQATLCLLSLSRRSAIVGLDENPAPAPGQPSASSRVPAAQPVPTPRDAGENPSGEVESVDIGRWQPVAELLVRDGVTSKDPQLVATILAQSEAGVPPSTIGRHHRVHHTTVGRILSAAEELSA